MTPTQRALAIVRAEAAPALEERPAADAFGPVTIDTTGRFLRRGDIACLVDLRAERIPVFPEPVRAACRTRTTFWFSSLRDGILGQPREVVAGGALVFVLAIDRTGDLGGGRAPSGSYAVAAIGGVR